MFYLQKTHILIATVVALLFATVQPLLQANPQIALAQIESNPAGKIAVASDNDPILLLMTELSVLMLENAGYEVDYRREIGASNYTLEYLPNAAAPELEAATEIDTHTVLHEGSIDFHWAHPQKSLAEHLKIDSSLIPNDSKKAWQLAFATNNNYTELSWLAPTEFFDAYSLFVRPGAISDNLTTIQDLADILNQDNGDLRLCVDQNFHTNANGLQALQHHYRFTFLPDNIEVVEFSELYAALAAGQCDVSLGSVIDWQAASFELQTLIDSESFFPMYSPAPMVLDNFLELHPEIDELFTALTSALDAKTVIGLNMRLYAGADGILGNGDEESMEEVARTFLIEQGLLPKPQIVVASKNYTEQLILGQMLALLLEDAGYEVIDKTGYGDTEAVRAAMINGEIDTFIDMTGDALSTYHNLPSPALPSEPTRAFELARGLDSTNGIEWLGLGVFNNSRTLMVRDELVQAGIRTIGELAASVNTGTIQPRICMESTFYSQRQDGFDALQQVYGFQFDEQLVELMDIDSAYEGLQSGDCDVALGNSTDGRGNAWGFTNLVDTLEFFLPNNPAPVVRRAVLDANPELRDLLMLAMPFLDDATISGLNARVDIGADGIFNSGDEESANAVAKSFLQKQRLLKLPPIVVASQDYTEQYVLGNLLLLLLQDAGYEVIDKNRLGDLETVRAALLNGEVDVTMELTGDALSVHHNLPSAALPSDPLRTFELARSLDTANNLVWLDVGPFNDTWTLMVRDDLLEKGIKTIDDLATYVNADTELPLICVESLFFSRPQDGFDGLQELYEFQFPDELIELMDVDSAYDALRSGDCDIAQGYSTDGRGSAWGFTNLEDTRSFFPYYSPSPVIRREVLEANPQIEEMLTSILPFLDDETMRTLNARVDIGADGAFNSGDEESPAAVARDFLNRISVNIQAGTTVTEAGASEGSVEETTAEQTADEPQDAEPELPEETAPAETAPADVGISTTETTNGAGAQTGEVAADATSENIAETESIEPPLVPDPVSDFIPDLVSELDEEAKTPREALTSFVETASAENDGGSAQPPQLVMSIWGTTEQQLLGEMIALMLDDVGYEVRRDDTQTAADARAALENGNIDLYAEMTSNALKSIYGLPESTLPTDPDRSLRLIRRLDEPNDVAWLAVSDANSTPTLIIHADLADKGIATIEDLAALTRESDQRPSLCIEESALESIPFGLERLQQIYRMVFLPEDILVTDSNDLYAALQDGRCDVAQGLSTDGHIAGWNLVPLDDTLAFFPASMPAPAVRQEFLNENPSIAPYLEELRTHLTSVRYRELAAQIITGADGTIDSGDEISMRSAAQLFLCDSGLIAKCSSDDIAAQSAEALAPADDGPTTSELTSTASSDTESPSVAPEIASVEEVNAEVEPDASTSIPILANPLLPARNNTPSGVEITIPPEYGVNARFTSDTDSTVVEVLARGSTVTAIGRTADSMWLQVELRDQRLVWIFAEAVFYSPGTLDSLPIVTPPQLTTTP